MQHPLPEVFRTLFRQEKLAKEDGGLLFWQKKIERNNLYELD